MNQMRDDVITITNNSTNANWMHGGTQFELMMNRFLLFLKPRYEDDTIKGMQYRVAEKLQNTVIWIKTDALELNAEFKISATGTPGLFQGSRMRSFIIEKDFRIDLLLRLDAFEGSFTGSSQSCA